MRTTTDPPMRKRLLWFVALWAGGVLTVGAVALVLRLALNAVLLGR